MVIFSRFFLASKYSVIKDNYILDNPMSVLQKGYKIKTVTVKWWRGLLTIYCKHLFI